MRDATVLQVIAKFSAELDLSLLPSEVINRTKYTIMDAIDNCIEGSAYKTVSDAVYAAAGPGDTTVFAGLETRSLSDAVFYNVAVGCITARNDHHAGGNVHAGSVIIPAVLALAEKEHFSGKALIESVVVGYEVMIRIGKTLKKGKTYPVSNSIRASMLPAPVGIAAAICKLYSLDEATTVSAMALACNHICGINQWRLEGTSEDVYQCAWDAVNAISCVNLARAGVRGAAGNLDGEYGFLEIFEARNAWKPVFEDLGRNYLILETRSKVTGACARVLAPCQIAQAYNEDPDFDIYALEKLTVHINQKCTRMSWFTNRNITCQSESINSVPYAAALTLYQGDINKVSWLPPYPQESFEIMDKIELVYDDYSKDTLDPDGYLFEAQMKDGKKICKQMLTYLPLADDKIVERFLSSASDVFGPVKAEEMRGQILKLEHMSDIYDFTKLFQCL